MFAYLFDLEGNPVESIEDISPQCYTLVISSNLNFKGLKFFMRGQRRKKFEEFIQCIKELEFQLLKDDNNIVIIRNKKRVFGKFNSLE